MPDSFALDRGLPTEARMRAVYPVLRALLIVSAMALPATAKDQPAQLPLPSDMTLNFAVMRNGTQIGTSTIRLRRDGEETVAESVTRIRVKIAYVTVYRFDQTQTERWA